MAIKSLSRILLLSERKDIINFFEVTCGSTITLSVRTELANLPTVEFELLIFDASLINGKTNSFYRCLELFSDRFICLLPFDSPSGLRNYAEHKFKYIIPFPISLGNLKSNLLTIQSLIQQKFTPEDFALMENENIPDTVSGYFCGSSSKIKVVRKKILTVAGNSEPVLLLGETGTGKTTGAVLIHSLSDRKDKKIVQHDFSAIVESLAESKFFGHVKGAFTNAFKEEIGLLEKANGSTLFLDGLGLASLGIQAILLPVLETGIFIKVGSQEEQHADVRWIFATNADLTKMLREGTFRKDLYHRINDNIIRLPPLRERKEDIWDIVESYISKEEYSIKEDALAKLENYSWPGNIRQLHKCLLHAMDKAKEDHMICVKHIDFGDISIPQ